MTQETFQKTLDDFLKFTSEIKLENVFLNCGTLLGFIREQKFLIYDLDIDLSVKEEDVPNGIFDLMKKECKKYNFYFKHQFGNLKYSYEISFVHLQTGIKVDLMICYKDKEDPGIRYHASHRHPIVRSKKFNCCRWGKQEYELSELKVGDRVYKIPENPESFLEQAYGEDWRTPKNFGYIEGISKGLYKGLMD